MALFITFEGGEGSGKSAQSKVLYEKLTKQAIPVVLTHEPGGTPLGDKMSRLLKWTNDTDISPMTELLLFNAARAQLVTEIVKPSLKKGVIVICDRYADSTIAYQSYGRGLDLEIVKLVNHTATQGLKPDLTFLLNTPSEIGLARKKQQKKDRFEREHLAFHQKVRQGYLKLAADESERWLVVDASQSKAKIAKVIWQRVSELLPQRRV
jgi:dTMP kinase|tara:strand:+ start:247 stop:873 length:627 start_codon:yes stop_codon:yes gene_type:complete